MKNMRIVVTICLAAGLFLSGCADTKEVGNAIAQDRKQNLQKILEWNLGELKEEASQKEREELISLLDKIETKMEERKEKGEFFPDRKEVGWRTKFSEILDEISKREYPDEADVSGFDEQEEEKVEGNNEDRIFSYMKQKLGWIDFLSFRYQYSKYEKTYDEELYDKIISFLKDNGIEEAEFYFFLLLQYPTQETKAVFQISDKLDFVEKTLFTDSNHEINKWEEEDKNLLKMKLQSVIDDKNLKQFDYVVVTTDGEYNNLASVVESPDGDGSGERWAIQVDPADMDEEFMETLVHEYGHYLTLNSKEVEYTDSYDLSRYCEEGMVALEDSVMNQFYQTFWKDYRVDELPTNHMFYVRNQNSFVTEYAATDPAEDIAESFLFFVKEDKPEGNSLAEEKMRFFYRYPHLVEIRSMIRSKVKF